MSQRYARSAPARVLLSGLVVVVISIVGSMVATHAMFQINGAIHYRDAMLVSFFIPALVAPPSYIHYARTARRMEDLNEQLNRLARQDALTGLDNRRAFVEQANARLGDGQTHMMVMVDLDHFKHINDSLGHAGGDLALQHAAAVIAAAVPQDALVARLGGEEFGLLLAMPAGEGWSAWGEAMAETVRLRLEALPLITPAGLTRITASFGIAMSRPDESLDHLLCRADNALYQAKRAGRNQLAMAG